MVDIIEWFPLEGAIKSSNKDNNTTVSQILAEIDNVTEELTFIDGDYLISFDFFLNGIKIISFYCLHCLSVS